MEKAKSAILQMFYGQNGNVNSLKSFPKQDKLTDAVENNYCLLCEKLKPQAELLELFEKYVESLENYYDCEIDNIYAEGFKFGLLVGIEAGESKFGN